jgi:hypothetical protein
LTGAREYQICGIVVKRRSGLQEETEFAHPTGRAAGEARRDRVLQYRRLATSPTEEDHFGVPATEEAGSARR